MSGPIDLFLVAGQSNALGYGDSALSPATVAGMAYEVRPTTGVVQQLTDPTYLSDTGSAWPAFANELTAHSGIPIAITVAAVGGSELLQEYDGTGTSNWSPTGTLFDTSVTRLNNAITKLTEAGWTPTFRGVLWSQGEYDGMWGNADPTTLRTLYEAAFINLLARYKSALGAGTKVYVWRTGTHPSYPAGFSAVRAAQDAACASEPDLVMVYTGTLGFPGLGYMEDSFHYAQPGLNLMGTAGALAVAEDLGYYTPPPDPDPVPVARSSILARRLLGL